MLVRFNTKDAEELAKGFPATPEELFGYHAIIVDDLEGRVVFANQKFFDLFGIADPVLDGIRLEDYVAPEWRAQQRELHDRRVRGVAVPDHFECEGLRRDGSRVWLDGVFMSMTPCGVHAIIRLSDRALQEVSELALTEDLLDALQCTLPHGQIEGFVANEDELPHVELPEPVKPYNV